MIGLCLKQLTKATRYTYLREVWLLRTKLREKETKGINTIKMNNLSDFCKEIKDFDTTDWRDYKRYDVDHNLLAHYKKDDNGDWQDVLKDTLQQELLSLIETLKSYDDAYMLMPITGHLESNIDTFTCQELSQWCKNLKMYIEVHNTITEEGQDETTD